MDYVDYHFENLGLKFTIFEDGELLCGNWQRNVMDIYEMLDAEFAESLKELLDYLHEENPDIEYAITILDWKFMIRKFSEIYGML